MSLIQLYDLWEIKLYIGSKQCHMVGYSIHPHNCMILIEKPLPNISFSVPTQKYLVANISTAFIHTLI